MNGRLSTRDEVDEAVSLLDRIADANGDVEAFVQADGERLTFEAWRSAANGVAAGLEDLGVGPGDVVCLLLPSSIRYMICYQAIMRLGAITSGINLRLGLQEKGHIFRLSTPRVSIVDDQTDPLPSTAGTVVPWRQLAEWQGSAPPRQPVIDRTTPVLICWTSGTTGLPKGAVYCHANLRAVAEGCGVLSQPGDRRLSPLPFPHVGTMTRPWDEISKSITTVITPPEWTAAEALRLMAEEKVTVAQGVATQWELILRHPSIASRDLSNLRVAGIGGSLIPADLIERMQSVLRVPVIHRYASTETALISGTGLTDTGATVSETVGRPSPGVEVRIAGDDPSRSPGANRAGPVQVRSAAMMKGYWRDAEATAAAISPDGWLTVGDEGWFDEEGNLHLLGRMGDMYIRGGYNIHPVEVERVISSHPDVEQAVVAGIPDEVLGHIGVAFVVSANPPTLDELRTWVSGRLADYKAPDRMLTMAEFPITALGKVDRRTLIHHAIAHLRQ